MRRNLVVALTVLVAGAWVACSSNNNGNGTGYKPAPMTEPCSDRQPTGGSCTSRNDCCDDLRKLPVNTCVAGKCTPEKKEDEPCASSDECAYDFTCAARTDGGVPKTDAGTAAPGAMVCVPRLPTSCDDTMESYICGPGDTVLLCTGHAPNQIGTCANCMTESRRNEVYYCNGSTKVAFAVAGQGCATDQNAACTPDHGTLLICRDGKWTAYQACTGATPRCDYKISGSPGCADGCIGCTK